MTTRGRLRRVWRVITCWLTKAILKFCLFFLKSVTSLGNHIYANHHGQSFWCFNETCVCCNQYTKRKLDHQSIRNAKRNGCGGLHNFLNIQTNLYSDSLVHSNHRETRTILCRFHQLHYRALFRPRTWVLYAFGQ
jgi:hypothetical protein